MNRAQKVELVEELSEKLKTTPLVVLADYRGVTVPEITELRRQFREQGISYRVIKNTLTRRAVEGTPMEEIGEHLTGMTGVMMSGEDPIAAAKLLRSATKDLRKAERFVIKGGFFDGDAIDAAMVDKVADLPSKEELLVMLLRTMQEGPRQVLGVIQGPARDLLMILKNYENKLSEGAE